MLRSFCNYLRGQNSDISNSNAASVAEKVLSFRKIFKYSGLIVRLILPRFLCASTFLIIFLLVDVVALEVVVYQVGLLGGKFYKALSDKNLDDFKQLAFLAIGLIILDALMVSLRDFAAQLLGIVWRKYITLRIHELYFTNKNFYYLQQPKVYKATNKKPVFDSSPINETNSNIQSTSVLIDDNLVPKVISSAKSHTYDPASQNQSNLDNPDQRITQDVNALCKSLSSILPILLVSPFVIGWYTYQLFVNVGYYGPLTVFVYFFIWSLINGPLTKPIINVVYKQDKKEGDFRFKHMNLRSNAESIAFYDSSENELWNLNQHFNSLLNISYRRNWKELILKFFVNTSQYMGGIIAYLVLGIPIFNNILDDKSPAKLAEFISNYSFKCQYLIYLFTRLFNTLDDLSSIAGNSSRVGELFYKLKSNKNMPIFQPMNESGPETNSSVCFRIESLNVFIPDKSKLLIKQLSFSFRQGTNCLITGRSGCGKTSLFRCLNGLWSSYTGKIIMSKSFENRFFFLPQSSYFTSGSLLEQIIYPTIETEFLSINNEEELETHKHMIGTWLKTFNLEHLLNKVNLNLAHKPDFNWSTILSAGEQQRLSFLRVLFHKPKFVLLDEFTSSVDQETEALMYEYLSEIGTTFLSIAHRDTVRKYHNVEIKINNDSTCEILDLDSTRRLLV